MVGLIAYHKQWPNEVTRPDNIDGLNLLRFLYREQLGLPVGLFEPPVNARTGKTMGLSFDLTDENGDRLWRDWKGNLSRPFETKWWMLS